MSQRGPHPKHPCPKCAGRMIEETVGGQHYLECQNTDCGGRVLLDRKAPPITHYELPPATDKAPGKRHGGRPPLSAEARKNISEGMRRARALRTGKPMEPTTKTTLAPWPDAGTPMATTRSATASTIDRPRATVQTTAQREAMPVVNLPTGKYAIESLALMIEALKAQIETAQEKIDTLTRAQAILGEIRAA